MKKNKVHVRSGFYLSDGGDLAMLDKQVLVCILNTSLKQYLSMCQSTFFSMFMDVHINSICSIIYIYAFSSVLNT